MTQPPRPKPDAFFECEVCELVFPLRDARHAILDGPIGSFEVQVCPDCYQNGIEDGIIEPLDRRARIVNFSNGLGIGPASLQRSK